MKTKELMRIAHKLYGTFSWQLKMSKALGVHPATIRRWAANNKVPGPAAIALKGLEHQAEEKRE